MFKRDLREQCLCLYPKAEKNAIRLFFIIMQELKLQEQEHQALTTHENTKRLQQTEHRKLSTDQRLVEKSSAQGDK